MQLEASGGIECRCEACETIGFRAARSANSKPSEYETGGIAIGLLDRASALGAIGIGRAGLSWVAQHFIVAQQAPPHSVPATSRSGMLHETARSSNGTHTSSAESKIAVNRLISPLSARSYPPRLRLPQAAQPQ